jgi:hypothetical protein
MPGRRIVYLGLLLLSLGVATTVILGPLVTDTITYRYSENMESQTIGGDATLLLVVVPALLLASYLWLRRSWHAPMLAIAATTFTSYTFLGFILIPDYARYDGNNEKYYPLFASVLALSIAMSVVAWSALGQSDPPEFTRRLRRSIALALLLVAGLFGLAWSGQIAEVIKGTYSTEYLEHPTGFWLIRTLDFALIIPASIATAIGLLRRNRTARKSAYALVGFVTVMLLSIVSMAVVMLVRDDPSADPAALALFIPATGGMALLFWKLWRNLNEPVGRAATSRDADHLGVPVHS